MSRTEVPLRSLAAVNGLQTGPFGSQLKAEEYTNNGIPVIMPKDVFSGRIVENGIARTSDDKAKKLAKHRVKPGDIIFPRRGDLGRIGVTTEENAGWICGTGCLRARLKDDVDSRYIHQYVQLESVKRWLKSNALGQTMLNLNTEIIGNLPIYVIPRKEQTAIADLLSTWDQAIEKIERLVEAKEKEFKCLLNKLINEENKGGKWLRVKLGAVAEIPPQEKLVSVERETLLTVRLHCKGIEENLRIEPKLTERGRPYFRRFAGELLIGRQNFHNGGFGIVPPELDGLIASNAITSLRVKKGLLDTDFLFCFLSRPNYYKRIGRIMDGTGQKELSDKQIRHLSLTIPPLDQQKQIASILNTARQEIDLLKKQAEAYRKQKRGLMQKLLTGTWRVIKKGEG